MYAHRPAQKCACTRASLAPNLLKWSLEQGEADSADRGLPEVQYYCTEQINRTSFLLKKKDISVTWSTKVVVELSVPFFLPMKKRKGSEPFCGCFPTCNIQYVCVIMIAFNISNAHYLVSHLITVLFWWGSTHILIPINVYTGVSWVYMSMSKQADRHATGTILVGLWLVLP